MKHQKNLISIHFIYIFRCFPRETNSTFNCLSIEVATRLSVVCSGVTPMIMKHFLCRWRYIVGNCSVPISYNDAQWKIGVQNLKYWINHRENVYSKTKRHQWNGITQSIHLITCNWDIVRVLTGSQYTCIFCDKEVSPLENALVVYLKVCPTSPLRISILSEISRLFFMSLNWCKNITNQTYRFIDSTTGPLSLSKNSIRVNSSSASNEEAFDKDEWRIVRPFPSIIKA